MAYRNRVKFATATTGTGSITVGAAASGFRTPAGAGMEDGESARYTIEDGTAWETGCTTKSGTTMTRELEESSTGALLNLSGSAVMYLTPTAKPMNQLTGRGKMLALSVGQVLN